jgi:hypothetical protein
LTNYSNTYHEDVAIGILAERCNVKATCDKRVWIRYDKEEDGVNMDERVVQHYVKSEEEICSCHESVPAS